MKPFELPADRPAIMGILNVTPDSFSDGGQFTSPEQAMGKGLALVAEGADLVDIGGESTRPGSEPVSVDEELGRVMPVVEGLVAQEVAVSIDTTKPDVARRALDAGAQVLNDISGFRNPEMLEVAAEFQPIVCTMHMQGTPQTMQQNPTYQDVVAEVLAELMNSAERLKQAGLKEENVWIDPGIGFGKTFEHNITLLQNLSKFVETGFPVLVGVSRKVFLGRILNPDNPAPVQDRLEATLAAHAWCQLQGVRIVRCHDVLASARHIRALSVLQLSDCSK